MKKSTKAIFLSALLFPGAGQFLLKKNLIAILLVTASIVALGFLMVPVVSAANQIAAKLVSGELQAGPDLIAEIQSVSNQVTIIGSTHIAGLALVSFWLIGVLHAWLSGKRLEK